MIKILEKRTHCQRNSDLGRLSAIRTMMHYAIITKMQASP